MTTDPAVRSTAPEIVGNGDPLAHWLAMGFSPISASSSMLTGWRSSWGTVRYLGDGRYAIAVTIPALELGRDH